MSDKSNDDIIYLQNAAIVAACDGDLHQRELEFLNNLAGLFNISKEDFDNIIINLRELEFQPLHEKKREYSLLYDCVTLTTIDEEISTVEYETCRQLSKALSWPPDTVDTILNNILKQQVSIYNQNVYSSLFNELKTLRLKEAEIVRAIKLFIKKGEVDFNFFADPKLNNFLLKYLYVIFVRGLHNNPHYLVKILMKLDLIENGQMKLEDFNQQLASSENSNEISYILLNEMNEEEIMEKIINALP